VAGGDAVILYTVVARRRQLTLWRTHAARQRWQILTARAVYYVQRCDAALAGLARSTR